jgi:hypothetical protein
MGEDEGEKNVVLIGYECKKDDDFHTHQILNPSFINLGAIPDIRKVTVNGAIDFDIVFSHFSEIARKMVVRPAPPLRVAATANNDMATMFLKDPKSVDICFLFSADKGLHLTGALWAHRNVLSQHRSFATLFREKDTFVRRERDNIFDTIEKELRVAGKPVVLGPIESPKLFISVDNVSIETFCALLYYIYTGSVKLSIDSTDFVINTWKDSRFLFRDDLSKFCETLRRHYHAQQAHLNHEDVTWSELLDAAVHYGITHLIELCEP